MPAPSNAAPAAPATICLVRLSALGDVVMVLPLIRMLRRNWPRARITWIIGRAALPLVATRALAGENVELIAIEKPRRLRDYLALRRQLQDRTFDALLCLQASWRANLLYPCIRARRKIGYSPDRANDLHALFVRERIPPAPPRSHIIDGFSQFAETLGGTRDASDYASPWPLTIDHDAMRALPSTPCLAVSPTASKPERNWTPAAYAAVIARAWRAHNLPAVLLGSPAAPDRAMSAQIRQNLPAEIPVTDLTGQTTLPQLAAIIQRSTALLAPDTGAVHIARALGTPVIGLYAVAPATRTGPYRATEYCIDKFADAVTRFTRNKNAGSTPWSFRVHDPRAMHLITPAEVCAQLDRLMKIKN